MSAAPTWQSLVTLKPHLVFKKCSQRVNPYFWRSKPLGTLFYTRHCCCDEKQTVNKIVDKLREHWPISQLLDFFLEAFVVGLFFTRENRAEIVTRHQYTSAKYDLCTQRRLEELSRACETAYPLRIKQEDGTEKSASLTPGLALIIHESEEMPRRIVVIIDALRMNTMNDDNVGGVAAAGNLTHSGDTIPKVSNHSSGNHLIIPVLELDDEASSPSSTEQKQQQQTDTVAKRHKKKFYKYARACDVYISAYLPTNGDLKYCCEHNGDKHTFALVQQFLKDEFQLELVKERFVSDLNPTEVKEHIDIFERENLYWTKCAERGAILSDIKGHI
ncbi:MAG: hypothetical protein WC763_06855 [Candidatus Paceibacterota bacterium]